MNWLDRIFHPLKNSIACQRQKCAASDLALSSQKNTCTFDFCLYKRVKSRCKRFKVVSFREIFNFQSWFYFNNNKNFDLLYQMRIRNSGKSSTKISKRLRQVPKNDSHLAVTVAAKYIIQIFFIWKWTGKHHRGNRITRDDQCVLVPLGMATARDMQVPFNK